MNEKKLIKTMISYRPCPKLPRRLKRPRFNDWDLSDGAIKLLEKNPNAILFAAIFDRLIFADRAWEAPYKLKNRIGHLNVERLSLMRKKELARYIGTESFSDALHRFPNKISECIISASKMLLEKYDGNAKNIWSDGLTAKIVVDRLLEFNGIGQKIANMTVNILGKYYGAKLTGWNKVDIAVDRHVGRVFLRTGLIDTQQRKTKYQVNEIKGLIIEKARKLNPEYPGCLDELSFEIGKRWCTQEKAYCNWKDEPCPLTNVCPKKINFNIK